LSDKQVIEASADHFDVLVVQGNLAISAPQGIATWRLDKPIWIDPITYAFAASPAYLRSSARSANGGYKKTFRDLANAFGVPYSTALDRESELSPQDFATEEALNSVERVLGWQETVFAPPEEDLKYGAEVISPVLITVPFFPLTVTNPASADEPPWLRTNLALIDRAASVRSGERLAVGFLAERDVFEHPSFEAWLQAYADKLREHRIRHLWWWISDHDEVATSLQSATRMLASFRNLGAQGVAVHQAFGGSLSSLALPNGLASVAHGVNYWESKGWEPIATGGLPTARYFHPALRERLRVPEAIAVIEHRLEDTSDFYDHVCSCDICRFVVGDDLAAFGAFGEVNIKTRRVRGGGTAEFDSPTAEALYKTKCHYLHAKGAEVELALESGSEARVHLLNDSAYWASDLTRTRHLERWALALSI